MKISKRASLLISATLLCFMSSPAAASSGKEEYVDIGGESFFVGLPHRFFPVFDKQGELLRFGAIAGSEIGFSSIGLDVQGNLSISDKEKWNEELCSRYIFPACLEILQGNRQNPTISFVLALGYFSGIPNSNRFIKSNFLDPDLAKSKELIDRAANGGLPEALNFRALMASLDWGKADPDAVGYSLPPSVEGDLEAAAGKKYRPAMLNLAGIYMDQKKYSDARRIYEELLAEDSDDIRRSLKLEASYALGIIYLAGYGVQSDAAKARAFFEETVPGLRNSRIPAEVAYNLGMMQYRGLGGEVDYKSAHDSMRSAANEKLPLAVAALPRIDKARRTEQSVMAAMADLRPGDGRSVQIIVPARPSQAAQTDPRYNPDCDLQYIEAERPGRYDDSPIPSTTDIYVVRVPANKVSPDFQAGYFVSKANPYLTFSNQYNSEKPVVTCKREISNSKRGFSEICTNNYTGTEFEPSQGLGYSIDKNGNVSQIDCGYCIQDKSGKNFNIGRRLGDIFNKKLRSYNSSNFRKIVDTDGRWRGAVATYSFEYWRGYQGNVDFLVTRTVQNGYFCSFNAPPSFNF